MILAYIFFSYGVCPLNQKNTIVGQKCYIPRSYPKFFFFPVPFIIFALLFSMPPSGNSDPGSHSRPFFSVHTAVRGLHFYLEKTPFNMSFPRRLASNHEQPAVNVAPSFPPPRQGEGIHELETRDESIDDGTCRASSRCFCSKFLTSSEYSSAKLTFFSC